MNKTRCCFLRPQHLQRRSYLDRGRLSRPVEQEAGVEPARLAGAREIEHEHWRC